MHTQHAHALQTQHASPTGPGTSVGDVDAELAYLGDFAARPEIYVARHAPAHRWYYYGEMARDEVMVFKQYDSQCRDVPRFTLHGAFDHPHFPPDAPLRQSIEVRCLVVFDRA